MAKTFLMAIDAGHGRDVGGNRCVKYLDPNQTAEWVLADRVSRAIAERAKLYAGFKTIRVDDVTGNEDVRLGERVRRANSAGVDFYLSNHFDAGIGGSYGGGVTAFCVATGGQAERYRDNLYEAVVETGRLRGNRSEPRKTENFYVLRNTDAPAVLIEYGFMDSPADVPVILTQEYTTAVGYAVADRLAKMYGLQRLRTFDDVAPEAYCFDAVEWAVKKGITKGTEKNKFSPDEPCTRAQAVTMLWARYGKPEPAGYEAFTDVAPTAYFSKAAQWSRSKGITAGVGDNKFGPDVPCTRAQIVTMLWAAAGRPDVGGDLPFDDVKESNYFAKAVKWAKAKGITAGVGGGKFAPHEPCSRAQMVCFLYKV